ncbi:MAG: alpha/beta hydrolase, partial [Bryobacteraceae bacterium]|nr:alpha/beta hydrolase [Bryobacteraceae bacterium]
MIVTPFALILSLLLGLLALAVVLVSVFLLRRANRHAELIEVRPDGTIVKTSLSDQDRSRKIVLLAIAAGLLLSVCFGRFAVLSLRPSGPDFPQDEFGPATRHVAGVKGEDLVVEESGPASAPRLIFTHGWGADRREWSYAGRRLSDRFRVVTWDLPGLGQSTPVPDGNYALETLASDLKAVLTATGPGPAILVGHSIGGMTNLTFFRLFGDNLENVAGVVQLNTTYKNPVTTVKNHEFAEALQKPVYEPLLHVITWTSPVVRALSWLSYQSGLAHLQNASSSFAGAETREQLDFVSKYFYRSSPGIVARGTLGMLHWDASDALARVKVPVLIISGDQDTTTLPSASEHMARTMQSATRIGVSPAAHLGPIEQHERYSSE